jgi:hypothetical protein
LLAQFRAFIRFPEVSSFVSWLPVPVVVTLLLLLLLLHIHALAYLRDHYKRATTTGAAVLIVSKVGGVLADRYPGAPFILVAASDAIVVIVAGALWLSDSTS